jgi:hydroxyacylglutathione hydrolase
MQVLPVPCLSDNYAFLASAGGETIVVDPSEAEPVEAALVDNDLTLSAIWLTHHHWDHVGGIEALCDARDGLPVLGSAYDLEHARIPRQSRGLREGDALTLGGHAVELLEIPGHTLGAIAYVVGGCLFSGDTLFLAGCGRVFEGTMAMMQQSLAKLRALPPSTRVYCGHEYTEANLRFASAVEPHNASVASRLEAVRALRVRGEVTVPAPLSEELQTNPFLRWAAPEAIAFASREAGDASSPAAVFGALRRAKDAFR